jgi:terpene synthase-like protein
MHLYTIPKLYCPFSSVMHPAVLHIEEHTNQWLLDYQIVDSIDLLRKYAEQRFAFMIARSYPCGEYIDLCAWCDINSLLFVVDDQLDETDMIKDKSGLLEFINGFIVVLEQRRRCSIIKDGPILAALSNFWLRICRRSSMDWQNIFVQGIRDMFNGGIWQYDHLVNGKKPDIGEYLENRQFLGAANLATDSLEVTAKVNLERHIYETNDVKRLTILARNAICTANDLFSLSKELAQSNGGAEFNLVTIIKKRDNSTIEEAIDKTAIYHDILVREFIEISSGIYKFSDSINQELRKYIEALGFLMRGNIDWSTWETSRYPFIIGL